MKRLKAIGGVAWMILSMAAAGALGQDPGPPGRTTIDNGRVRVQFDRASGSLRIQSGGRQFAVGRFAEPAAAVTVEKVGPETLLGPGSMLKIGSSRTGVSPVSENRVLVRDGSPWVLIRRDDRAASFGMLAPASPGNRVQALEATLDLGADAAKLKGLGPGRALRPRQEPGPARGDGPCRSRQSGAGVVAGLVQIDAASGVLLTKVEGGKVVLTLRNDYGSVVPPQLEPFGGDWWALGSFRRRPRRAGVLRRRVRPPPARQAQARARGVHDLVLGEVRRGPERDGRHRAVEVPGRARSRTSATASCRSTTSGRTARSATARQRTFTGSTPRGRTRAG